MPGPELPLVLSPALRLFLAGMADEAARQPVYAAVVREAQALAALPAGGERAREVHRRVEAAAERFARLKPDLLASVRCGRGCSHCCRIRVDLTRDEALLLAERVRAGSAHPDLVRLERQRTWSAPADFQGKPRAEADCVFLGGDGACTIYEDRPSACRALLVASDPELCRDAQASTRILALINPYLELEVSAAQTVDALAGPRDNWMAAALEAALR